MLFLKKSFFKYLLIEFWSREHLLRFLNPTLHTEFDQKFYHYYGWVGGFFIFYNLKFHNFHEGYLNSQHYNINKSLSYNVIGIFFYNAVSCFNINNYNTYIYIYEIKTNHSMIYTYLTKLKILHSLCCNLLNVHHLLSYK